MVNGSFAPSFSNQELGNLANYSLTKTVKIMTKEQYHRLLELKMMIHTTYGFPPKHPDNLDELYKEYMKLRKMYSDCKGKIEN